MNDALYYHKRPKNKERLALPYLPLSMYELININVDCESQWHLYFRHVGDDNGI